MSLLLILPSLLRKLRAFEGTSGLGVIIGSERSDRDYVIIIRSILMNKLRRFLELRILPHDAFRNRLVPPGSILLPHRAARAPPSFDHGLSLSRAEVSRPESERNGRTSFGLDYSLRSLAAALLHGTRTATRPTVSLHLQHILQGAVAEQRDSGDLRDRVSGSVRGVLRASVFPFSVSEKSFPLDGMTGHHVEQAAMLEPHI